MQEWVAVLSDEDEQDDTDETLDGWAKLKTVHSSSDPMYFAKKLAEVNVNVKKAYYMKELGNTFKMTGQHNYFLWPVETFSIFSVAILHGLMVVN